ncbi:hypothetical protein [Pontiella agarivorans]|uniref:Glycosyl hydrolase family 79, N-terminal domain n=1 Tax=Pontiella agarivorans TaxID=3038953 RepID=A0ABU5MY04_9BACT|nr:hypothetical protein [Pontiella agarivorans]MDZ8119057.1 hypothetical protein [Pontiella agarivorans]
MNWIRKMALLIVMTVAVFQGLVSVADEIFKSGTGTLSIELPLDQSHPLQKAVYGVNNLLISRPLGYQHPGFIKAYEYAGCPVIRYPGGTSANYINHMTGYFDIHKAAGFHVPEYERANRGILKQKDGFQVEEFLGFVAETGARFNLVLNICTMTYAENEAYMQRLQRAGAKLEFVELGNELYYGGPNRGYGYFYPEASDYAVGMEKYAHMIRSYFPEAKIGVIIPAEIFQHLDFTTEKQNRFGQWVTALQKYDYYDAVIMHMYSKIGVSLKDGKQPAGYEEAYRNALSYMDSRFGHAVKKVKGYFPGKKIWVTEYALASVFGKDAKTAPFKDISQTHAGNLGACAFTLKLFSEASIELASRHSFSGMVDLMDRKNLMSGGGRVVPNSVLDFFKLYSEVVQGGDRFLTPLIQGGHTYTGNEDGEYPDIAAGYFFTENYGRLVLINKGVMEYTVGPITSDNTPATIVACRQISPKRNLSIEEALASKDAVKQHELAQSELRNIILPPLSVTLITLEQEPLAPDSIGLLK